VAVHGTLTDDVVLENEGVHQWQPENTLIKVSRSSGIAAAKGEMVDVPQRIVCARPLRSLDVLCCQSNACDGAQRCLRVSLNVSFTNDAARLGCFHEGSFTAANDRTENTTVLPSIQMYISVI